MLKGEATENQIKYIRKLAEERVAQPGFEMKANLSKQEASDIIGKLLAIKPVAKLAQVMPAPVNVASDGMYRTPDGTIFKVQFNKAQGDGRRCYAKRLVIVRDAVRNTLGQVVEAAQVEFRYEAGAVAKLRPEYKMTLEQAKAFGALYGTCVRCGRTLTLEESIERSMGPVCAGKF